MCFVDSPVIFFVLIDVSANSGGTIEPEPAMVLFLGYDLLHSQTPPIKLGDTPLGTSSAK